MTTTVYLSPRQKQCIRAAAAGLEYREIADRLGLGLGTVRIHLAAVRAVLGARNTAQAVGLAVAHGIVTREHLSADQPGGAP